MMQIRRLEKHDGSKKRLELKKLWNELLIEDLIWLIMNSEQEPIQKKAWGKLKASGELILSDIYDLVYGPKFMRDELFEMFDEEVNDPEDLLEAMRSVYDFSERAEEKLFKILGAKNLRIRKGRAKHFLLRIIEEFPSSREKAFQYFRELSPSPAEFRRILDMEFIKSNPVMREMIEGLIRKAEKKDPRDKRIRKIDKLEKQIRKTKKEQN